MFVSCAVYKITRAWCYGHDHLLPSGHAGSNRLLASGHVNDNRLLASGHVNDNHLLASGHAGSDLFFVQHRTHGVGAG